MYGINTDSSYMQTSDSLLWVISHVCKEPGKYTADDPISKAYKDAVSVRFHKARGVEKQ